MARDKLIQDLREHPFITVGVPLVVAIVLLTLFASVFPIKFGIIGEVFLLYLVSIMSLLIFKIFKKAEGDTRMGDLMVPVIITIVLILLIFAVPTFFPSQFAIVGF